MVAEVIRNIDLLLTVPGPFIWAGLNRRICPCGVTFDIDTRTLTNCRRIDPVGCVSVCPECGNDPYAFGVG